MKTQFREESYDDMYIQFKASDLDGKYNPRGKNCLVFSGEETNNLYEFLKRRFEGDDEWTLLSEFDDDDEDPD